jgi:membrane dipeptidase
MADGGSPPHEGDTMQRRTVWRERWVSVLAVLVLATGAFATAAVALGPQKGGQEQALEARVAKILAEVPLIDGHNDLAEQLCDRVKDRWDRLDIASDTSTLDPPMHTDIPRLRRGHVGGQFWSVYVPTSLKGPEAVQAVFEQIDLIHRMIERYPDTFAMAYTAADVERIHRSGKIASLIGMEGGHSIGDSLAVLREAYTCGARYMTLTHWDDTDWADAATDKPRHNGLTRFGREVVHEMNRLGMLVDLSHVSDKTMLDAIETSEAPVIFSHSSARALCDHVRNVPDDILRKAAATGGIVMVNFAPGFISNEAKAWDEQAFPERSRLNALYPNDPQRAKAEFAAWKAAHPAPIVTVSQVADHIEHIRQVAGIDHVGLGSDFDGISRTPTGLEDVSKYPALLAELLRRGWSDGDVKKLAGENILRVMRKVEEVAARLQKTRPPSEERIEDLDVPPVIPEHARPGGSSSR